MTVIRSQIGHRGLAGTLTEADRLKVEAAIRAGASLDLALTKVEATGQAAQEAADQLAVARDAAQTSAQAAATLAGQAGDAAGAAALSAGNADDAAREAVTAADKITGMQVATGAAGSAAAWNGQTLTVPQGLPGGRGRGVQLQTHATLAEALTAAAGDSPEDDPLILRIVPIAGAG